MARPTHTDEITERHVSLGRIHTERFGTHPSGFARGSRSLLFRFTLYAQRFAFQMRYENISVHVQKRYVLLA